MGHPFAPIETNEIVVTLASTFTESLNPKYNKPHDDWKNQLCCFINI